MIKYPHLIIIKFGLFLFFGKVLFFSIIYVH